MRSKSLLVLTILSYSTFVLAMWGTFGPFNGMSYETQFAVQSDTVSLFKGFFFNDPLRIYTNVFYHLGYLVSKLFGCVGSWVGYQIVYALLWLGRGVLCFLIVRRLVPSARAFAYLVGALAIFHAADHTLNWVGQMNQFGFIFWMLLSFYLLQCALEAGPWRKALALALAAALFCHLSLWSYEAQLPLMLLVPLFLAAWHRRCDRRALALAAIVLVPAVVYLALNVGRYYGGGGGEYQLTVLRADATPANLLADLGFNLKYALFFWHWAELLPTPYSTATFTAVPIAGAALLAVGMVAVMATTPATEGLLPRARPLAALLVASAVALVASFPAYLILNSARWLWRTQTLAGPPAALLTATLVALALCGIGRFRPLGRMSPLLQRATLLAVGMAVAFSGTLASLRTASFHFAIWERARATMEQIVEVAPNLATGTRLVLLDVPPRTNGQPIAGGRIEDPFGDSGVFDMSVMLAYPRQQVEGYYFLTGGVAPPGNNFAADAARLSLSNLVILTWNDGKLQLAGSVPAELKLPASMPGHYDPARLIRPGPPTREAQCRYLLKAPWIAP